VEASYANRVGEAKEGASDPVSAATR